MDPFVTTVRSSSADAITGERLGFDEPVIDTGIRNKPSPCMRNSRNRLVKESTIVWLAEAAGYTLIKRDAGDSGDAKSVDAGDVESGNGEAEVGKAKAGGRKASKRRSDGPIEGE
jgi:hypothetical protein